MQEARLIEQAVARLPDLGLRLHGPIRQEHLKRRGINATITIARGNARHRFVVEARRAVAPATLGATLAQLEAAKQATKLPGLLVTTHVTPQLGERLRELHVPFVDIAGNCYLETNDFLVYVAGNRARTTEAAPAAHVFKPAGIKVLFALICAPDLAGATHRDIAAAAGVALGAVPTALMALRDTGRLLTTATARRLHATKRLLDEWALGYAQRLRPKTLVGRYEVPDAGTWRRWPLAPTTARWGGEPAANLLAGHLRPGVLTIYADKLPAELIVARRMKRVHDATAGGGLELRKPFWGKTLVHAGRPDTVAPPLVYADLLATGEARCLEMAQRLYDEHLARLFPAR